MHSSKYLLAAVQGYFSLGMFQEAYDELDELPPEARTSQEVLEFRVAILHALGSWDLAREVSKFLREASPENSQYVIWEAYATRRISGVEAARKILWDARESHGSEPILFFNLACYDAQLGNLDEAKELLARAIDLDKGIRLMVLDEPDLEPIWESWGA